MGLREIKNRARRDLHAAMQVGALYIPDPADPVPVPCTVRVHSKFDALGELKGTSFDYSERYENIPHLVFLVEEVPAPVRGAVVTITDPATSIREAYRIDNRQPPDGITVTADVTILTPEEYADLPFPGEDWSMVAEAPIDGKIYGRRNAAWVILKETTFLDYTAKTNSTVAADPGDGKVAWNSAAQNDATEIYVAARTNDNKELGALWRRLLIGSSLAIQSKTDSNQFMHYTVSAITDNGTWFKINVVPVDSLGVAFGGNNALLVAMQYAVGE